MGKNFFQKLLPKSVKYSQVDNWIYLICQIFCIQGSPLLSLGYFGKVPSSNALFIMFEITGAIWKEVCFSN